MRATGIASIWIGSDRSIAIQSGDIGSVCSIHGAGAFGTYANIVSPEYGYTKRENLSQEGRRYIPSVRTNRRRGGANTAPRCARSVLLVSHLRPAGVAGGGAACRAPLGAVLSGRHILGGGLRVGSLPRAVRAACDLCDKHNTRVTQTQHRDTNITPSRAVRATCRRATRRALRLRLLSHPEVITN
eukprot:4176033-Pyramimonas_sp.AAC.1